MSTLNDLDTGTAEVVDKDVVGNSYATLESDLYPFFIEEAFIEMAKSGAMGIHLTLKENQDGTGKVLEKTVYVRSGDEKGNKSYFIDKDKNQQPLPGFMLMDTLCEIIAGKKLKEMSTTKMVAEVYDSVEKKRVPQEVQMLKALLKKPVYVGVIKQITDKQVKNDAGKYINTGETREENEIVKFFRAKDKKTATECAAKNDLPAAHVVQWLEAWKGKVRDRSTTGSKSAPAGAADSAGVTTMFDKP